MLENNISVLLGRKGQGKTTLMFELSQQAPRLVAIDPLHRFSLSAASPDLREVWSLSKKGRARYRVRVGVRSKAQAEMVAANAYALGNTLLIIDELSLWYDANTRHGALVGCIMLGRNRKLDLAATARRSTEIPRALTSQADDWYLFNTQEPGDLSYLAAATLPSVAAKARALPRFSCLVYRSGSARATVRRVKPPSNVKG